MPDTTEDPSTEPDTLDDGSLDAGDVGAWLVEVQAAIAGDQGSDVPCGSCVGCCTSAQFVHIAPDEIDTLAHIPRALTFPAPGLPAGHVLLGYDERGHCPMLVDRGCSIYAHRPRTCRTYDCRVFAAAAIAPDDTKVEIGRRVERWRFRAATDSDRSTLAAIRSAASFLRTHAAELGSRSATVPTSPTQLAVLAIEVHPVFLTGADDGPPELDTVARELRRIRELRRPD